MTPIQITRQVQIDFNNHNAAINRARNEYAAHPIAACTTRNCPELALDGDIWCRPCKRFRDKGVRRNRAWRAKQKEKAK